MGVASTVIAILFVVVVAPIWIVSHYATRWRSTRSLSREQEQVLAELWETAQKMEERVDSLERILDSEAPGWRGRAQPWTKADPWTRAEP